MMKHCLQKGRKDKVSEKLEESEILKHFFALSMVRTDNSEKIHMTSIYCHRNSLE